MPIFVDFQSSITDELLKESAPLDSEAAVFFGDILKSRSKDLESETYFRMAADSGDLKGIEAIGESLQKRAKNNEAIVWLQQAVDLNSQKAQIPLARALYAVGQHVKAERILDNASATEVEDPFFFNYRIAEEFFAIGSYEKAILKFEASYRDALGSNRDFVASLIADIFLLLKKPSEAKAWLEAINEEWEETLLLEGDCLMLEENFNEAIMKYLQLTSLKSDEDPRNQYDVFAGLKIAKAYKLAGEKRDFKKWKIYAEKLADSVATMVFSDYWKNWDPMIRKSQIDSSSSLVIELNLENEISNTWSNWGIFDFREGRLEHARVKLHTALDQKDGKAEAEASFFLTYIYAEMGELEISDQMKSRSLAAGGYAPSKIDRDRIRLLNPDYLPED